MTVRLAALLGLAVLAMLGSRLAGGTWIALPQILGAPAHPHNGGDAATIVWQLRLPRVLIGAVVGMALSIACALLQGLLRNPIVDPFFTGVSAGAAVAIVVGMTACIALAALPALGFAAGMATALIVAALARRGSGLDATRLILARVSLSSLFSAIIALVTHAFANDGCGPCDYRLAGGIACGTRMERSLRLRCHMRLREWCSHL